MMKTDEVFGQDSGIPTAIAAVASLTFVSGIIVAAVMYETLPARPGLLPTRAEPNPEAVP